MAQRQRIIISEFMDAGAVAVLQQRFDTVYDPGLVERRNDLLDLVGDANALIVRNRTRVDRGLLDVAPQLKVIGRLGVGLDNIDLASCEGRGLKVIPAIGANALAVAEYVIATAMLLLRGAYTSTGAVAAGQWPRASVSNGREIAGKTLGIIGFGSIGRVTGKLARAVGMEVIGFDAQIAGDAPIWNEERTTSHHFDEVLRQADVVTLHVPLTAATRNLIDRGELALLRPEAILINTARGGVVNEAALAAALRAGRLGGAALDVFEQEPRQPASPLLDCPNLILTPHIAGVTRESNLRVSALIADAVSAALGGHGSGSG